MAEWFMEGFIARLLDADDSVAKTLLQDVCFYLVPSMNPDGAARGNLRTNAAGTDLNRAWASASIEKSPEVFCVLEKMHETGVDFFLDVHGDEGLPYNFLAGAEQMPNYNDNIARLCKVFSDALLIASPDFQTEFGYDSDRLIEGMEGLAVNHVVNTFKCPGYTLEMPFKDNANMPDAETGWSPARSGLLGAATLDALLAVLRS